MNKITLGKFSVPPYVADKPVGIHRNGELIYPLDLLQKKSAPSYGASLSTRKNKIKLTLARLAAEPSFYIGVINKNGSYSKDEVIKHITDQTSLGVHLMDMETRYAEHFAKQLLGDVTLNPGQVLSAAPKPLDIPVDWQWVPESHRSLFKSRVLFCESSSDELTDSAARYRIAHVHKVFADNGFEVISLEGADDVRENFQLHAIDPRVVYISGTGHGNYSSYTGNMKTAILESGGYSSDEVKDKAIHFLSCETGRNLGPNCVKNGASAYAGYNENFIFDLANAETYWECDSTFDISMATGKTTEQAITDTVMAYDTAITTFAGTHTASMLTSNRDILRSPVSGIAWGNKNITINPQIFNTVPFQKFMAR